MPSNAYSLSGSEDFEILTNSLSTSPVSAVAIPSRIMDPTSILSPIRSKESDIVASLSPSESADMLLALLTKHQQSIASIVSPGLSEEKSASVVSTRDEVPSKTTKHERFFFLDGNVTFVVKDTLYRVHQYFFSRDSSHFVDLFSRHDNEGKSITITLENVEMRGFDAFLSILYPTNFKTSDISTAEDWTSVLELSHRWGFKSIRELAIERLGPISSPVDKVVHGRTFGVDHWLTPGYTALVERTEPLSQQEGRRLGVDDVILISTLREDARAKALILANTDIVRQVEKRLHAGREDEKVEVDASKKGEKTVKEDDRHNLFTRLRPPSLQNQSEKGEPVQNPKLFGFGTPTKTSGLTIHFNLDESIIVTGSPLRSDTDGGAGPTVVNY
ncbi:hypothetical protein EW146_g59 [Bondarzewia mesenterica]|uniref:BTB domain-containing protein n=1 Tax=Bondarzewia mesenterica TaxID=1095465 RepID=A0A4S4M8T1_9AGAM|nr:hypothetical protein EW146_g59 [Bondarzewia mesenterica]